MYPGEKAMVGGLVTRIRTLVTKTGKNPGQEMCQFWVELPLHSKEDSEVDGEEAEPQDESVQIVAFPDAYKRVKDQLEIGAPVLLEIEKIKGGLSLRNVFRLDLLKEKV